MVAWAADDSLLPRGGTRGFPHWGVWTERNKAFQTDIVGWLVQAQPAMASKVATRWGPAGCSCSGAPLAA